MDKRIVEINGIKMEIDMESARRVDEFRVGDNVKVLKDKKNILDGVIVDFVNFKDLPTIKIAYFDNDYWSGNAIKFVNYNSQTEDIEIMPACQTDIKIEKSRVVDKIQGEIDKKQAELDSLRAKLRWFYDYYGKYFADVEEHNEE